MMHLFNAVLFVAVVSSAANYDAAKNYQHNPFFNPAGVEPSRTLVSAVPPVDPLLPAFKQNLNQYQLAFLTSDANNNNNQLQQPVQNYGGGGIYINVPYNGYFPTPVAPVHPPVTQAPPTYPTRGPPTHAPITHGPPSGGGYRPGVVVTEKPHVPTAHPPIHPPHGDGLGKWCLKPIGQFQSAYCNKFVNCWEHNVVEQFCPQTLLFNPKGYCDFAYNVDCMGKPIQPIPVVSPVGPTYGGWPSDGSYVPPVTAKPPAPITIAPRPPYGPVTPASPTQTYPTPTHHHHTVTHGPVTPAYQHPTVPHVTQPPITVPSVRPDLIKLCLRPRGQFLGTSCSKYVNCWDETVYEQDCPAGLHFNQKRGYCDYPYNCDCQDPVPFITPRSIITDELTCPLAQGTFRNRDNCDQYFTCNDNEIVAKYACPDQYLFNDMLGVCDLAYRVDCTRDPYAFYPALKNADNILKIPSVVMDPSAQCKYGTVYKLQADCGRVAVCRDGLTEIIQCPSHLAYDVLTDTCIAPELAQC